MNRRSLHMLLGGMLLVAPGLGFAAAGLGLEGNGQSASLTITPSSQLSVAASLTAGDEAGLPADWWMVRLDPDGSWAYFVPPDLWVEVGRDLMAVRPAHQGPLADLPPFTVWQGSGLPEGRHTFFFGFDRVANGWLDLAHVRYQRLDVDVTTEVKALIRQAVLSMNALLAETIVEIDTLLENAVVNAGCSFHAEVGIPIVINGLTHDSFARGAAELYAHGRRLTCETLLNGLRLHVSSADISGEGYLHGAVVDADYQGDFHVSGSDGFLVTGHLLDAIYVSDEYIVEGSGAVRNIALDGVRYPDVRGDVIGVHIDMRQALALLERIYHGGTLDLADGARLAKKGHIDGTATLCSSFRMQFTGTRWVDLTTDCTVPRQFSVDVATGAIRE